MLLRQGNCLTPGGQDSSRWPGEGGEGRDLWRAAASPAQSHLTPAGANTAGSCSSGLNSSCLINSSQTAFVVGKFPSFLLQHSALAFPPDISRLSGDLGISPLVWWQEFYRRSCLS